MVALFLLRVLIGEDDKVGKVDVSISVEVKVTLIAGVTSGQAKVLDEDDKVGEVLLSIAVEVYAYFAAPANGEGDVFVALSVGYVFHDRQEHFIGGFVAPCQGAGGIIGVEWVVCGVVVGGNGVDLGSRSYFLILGEGVIALPVKIPVLNTDEVGAVALWVRGIDFPGFAQ